MSSGGFNTLKPSRTLALLREMGLRSGLTWVRSGSMLPNLLESLFDGGKWGYTIVSDEFGVVQHSRTFPNPCLTEVQCL